MSHRRPAVASRHAQIGYGAAALKHEAPVGLRYHYLSGGVNPW